MGFYHTWLEFVIWFYFIQISGFFCAYLCITLWISFYGFAICDWHWWFWSYFHEVLTIFTSLFFGLFTSLFFGLCIHYSLNFVFGFAFFDWHWWFWSYSREVLLIYYVYTSFVCVCIPFLVFSMDVPYLIKISDFEQREKSLALKKYYYINQWLVTWQFFGVSVLRLHVCDFCFFKFCVYIPLSNFLLMGLPYLSEIGFSPLPFTCSGFCLRPSRRDIKKEGKGNLLPCELVCFLDVTKMQQIPTWLKKKGKRT